LSVGASLGGKDVFLPDHRLTMRPLRFAAEVVFKIKDEAKK